MAFSLISQMLRKRQDALAHNEQLLLLALAAIQFTHIVDFMIMMPLGPQLMRLFDVGPLEFGLLVSAYSWSGGISGLFAALVLDRFDRKRALLLMYLGFISGTLACAFAPTYEILLLSRALAGAFGGVLGSLVLAIVGDAIPEVRRGRAMGVVSTAFSLASVFGVPFGLWLATLFSWHAPFLFVAAVGAVLLLLITWRFPSMRGHIALDGVSEPPFTALKEISANPNQRMALLFMFLLMLSQFVVVPYLSPSMVANVGLTERELPYIYFMGGGLTIFSAPYVGRMADRYGKHKLFTILAFLLVIPMLIITHLGPTSLPLALAATTLYFVFGNGRFVPAMAMITSTVLPRRRGSFMSVNTCVQQLTAGLAAFLAGAVVQRTPSGNLIHYNWVGYFACVASLGAIYVGRRLRNVEGPVIIVGPIHP